MDNLEVRLFSSEQLFSDIDTPKQDPLNGYRIDVEDNNDLTDIDKIKCLVPIFANKELNEFVGNGVIIDSYLITAAHVAQSEDRKTRYEYLYYIYDNKKYEVKEEQVVHDGRNYNYTDSIHDDLLIYKINDNYNSFKFYEEEPSVDMLLYSKQHDYNNENHVMNSYYNKSIYKRRNKEWENCFDVHGIFHYNKGDSGCAVYRDNILYGILIIGNNDTNIYKIIDAKYIKYCIENSKSNEI